MFLIRNYSLIKIKTDSKFAWVNKSQMLFRILLKFLMKILLDPIVIISALLLLSSDRLIPF